MTNLSQRAHVAFVISLVSLSGLIAVFLIRFLILFPPNNPVTIVAIYCLPLLAFIPGLLKHKPRVYIWLCFVILLYFCQAVINAFALPSLYGVIGLLETLLTVSLFSASMLAARYYAKVN